ncbi:PRC-barrel domain-containing protein [Palleronia rufa]|uniref:PRC-barrel domain-containing protein n=2 Tax=Palleronia rufa TaxID=1530186 RepID=UPI00056367AF|nr:PRC-barrel domain-containing protein [Palleronia rufa]
MRRTSTIGNLLLGTALSLPLATTAVGQSLVDINEDELASKSEACQTLAQDYKGMDDPTIIPEEDVVTAINDDATEECTRLQDEIAAASGQSGTTDQSTTETETTSEQVDLSEEATIEGQAEVTVPEPNVDVSVPAPDVTVTQQQPNVTVSQQPTDLQVDQEKPKITVEIPDIRVTVQIPAPQFYLLKQDPNVQVSTQDPQVQVEQGDPSVDVTQADPQVNLELGQDATASGTQDTGTQDSGDGSAQSVDGNVQASSGGDANVDITTADGQPQVSMEGGGDPTVSYQSPEPEVTVMMAEKPTINIEQTGEATITLETQEERDARLAQNESGGQSADQSQQSSDQSAQSSSGGSTDTAEPSPAASGGGSSMTVGDLLGMDVVTSNGENLGAPEAFVEINGEPNMVLSSGGFLGLGAKQVPVPISRVSVNGEQLVVDSLTESEIEAADDFEYDSNLELADDQQISIGG